VFTALAAFPASADGPLFSESFAAYDDGSNLLGQAGWDRLTNQGTAPEMPVTEGDLLPSGQVPNTRAIKEADRIHQVGHALHAFSADVLTTFSVTVVALVDSMNSGIGIGTNPVPDRKSQPPRGFSPPVARARTPTPTAGDSTCAGSPGTTWRTTSLGPRDSGSR
jgi:hypothetical protein